MSILKLEGLLENQLDASGDIDPSAPNTRLHFRSGKTVVIPTELLFADPQASDDGATDAERESAKQASPRRTDGRGSPEPVPVPQKPAMSPDATSTDRSQPNASSLQDAQMIPLIEEQLTVGKREVETGRVRLSRETEEFMQQITMPFQHTSWQLEHVPVNQVVAEVPAIRQTDDLIVFPLVEERLVVTRELFLREEVHARKVITTIEKSASFPLKRDILKETRTPSTPDTTP